VEFGEVVRRRKMVRTYLARPIEPAAVERILRNGQRGPSAGFTQGFEFLVVEGAEATARFWDVVGIERGNRAWPGEGLRGAPLIIVPFASKKQYLDRYAEGDKGWTDRDEGRWSAPFWTVDAAFAAMLMLLTAVDEGLGALFFGLYPPTLPAFRRAYGIPEEFEPIGALAVGHPAAADPVRSSAHTRSRRPLQEIVHRGRW
jgi:nitroreductase